MNLQTESRKEYKNGMLAAIGCPLLWGILPIYWKSLIPISPRTIILYRIVLVFLTALLMARIRYPREELLAPLKDRKQLFTLLLAGIIITINWSTFIWAVNSGHVIQSSVGYYIEPLMICAFGILFFHERMTRYKAAALLLAGTAILIILLHYHQIPGLALLLAVSFSIYSAIKKTVTQPPLISLIYETVFLTPPALVVIIWLEVTGRGALSAGAPYQMILLLLAGLMTAIPLALFAYAAQKVSLFTIGLTEYISPSMTLVLGIFLYHEPFDRVMFCAVALIWVGLGFFTLGGLRERLE